MDPKEELVPPKEQPSSGAVQPKPKPPQSQKTAYRYSGRETLQILFYIFLLWTLCMMGFATMIWIGRAVNR